MRHTGEHLLHQSVKELFPEIKLAMGPPTPEGFYFDFDPGKVKITPEDFPKIESRMAELKKLDLPMIREEISVKEARELFKGNPYKQEWIDRIEERQEKVTTYRTGKEGDKNSMVDLCAGPHAKTTGEVGPFKLLSIAGAYWRGDEKNKMLTRIYGTAFPTQKELDEYIWREAEAKKRDHKKLGRELELFMFHETSPGMAYWLPKGVIIYNLLIDYWREEHRKLGYSEIMSPLLNKTDLYVTSGHWDHYKEDMFIADMGENEVYGIKPMNCPNAMIVFGSKTRSYKDLPIRLSDTDRLHRYERSGTINGLLRIRSFQQDDSHNFISEDMIESEYKNIFNICEKFYRLFGLEFSYRLGTRPEKYLGDKKIWDKAEAALKRILVKSNKNYSVLEKDGAFYGPKVDIIMKDSLEREWQMGTIQLDFHQPSRFNLKYTDINGKATTPVVIHRVIYGSIERFIGIIVEHFGGAFPVWLHPVQIMIIPISVKQLDYAMRVEEKLISLIPELRVELDNSDETLGNKIRKAQTQKAPYMLIVGDKEVENNSVSLRLRDGKDGGVIKVEEFADKVSKIILNKDLELGFN
ncbi:MAG: threonine--tRNA ligase [bacterium]|nr:threonine--tRNA ligase [bacterium]